MHKLPKAQRFPRPRSHPTAKARWTGTGWVVSDGTWTTEEHDTPNEARDEWARWKDG